MADDGTEAAAASAVLIFESAAAVTSPPIEVKVDHSFLYVIRDQVSGVALFPGH